MLYTPEHKHNILTHYCVGVRGSGFHALARRFDVRGGAHLIQQWYSHWDGTPASLKEKARTGRPRILSTAQVQQHVRTPILRSNRMHHTMHYKSLLPKVQQSTGRSVSLRTLQRYGKKELGARQVRGKKRTADEREYIHVHSMLHIVLMHVIKTH
jgi:hypothetical protein